MESYGIGMMRIQLWGGFDMFISSVLVMVSDYLGVWMSDDIIRRRVSEFYIIMLGVMFKFNCYMNLLQVLMGFLDIQSMGRNREISWDRSVGGDWFG